MSDAFVWLSIASVGSGFGTFHSGVFRLSVFSCWLVHVALVLFFASGFVFVSGVTFDGVSRGVVWSIGVDFAVVSVLRCMLLRFVLVYVCRNL